MPTTLTLSAWTAVARAGSTDTWTGFPTLPATSGPYIAGDKSYYARAKITGAGSLVSLPQYLALTVNFDVDPNTSDANIVIDDVMSLGDVSGPLGTNAGTSLEIPVAPTAKTYNLPTDGITLLNLQTDNVYVWFGCKSLLTAAYVNGNFTFNGTGAVNDHSAQVLDVTTNFSITWDYPGTDPAYVIAQMTATAKSDGVAVFPAVLGYTGVANADNGVTTDPIPFNPPEAIAVPALGPPDAEAQAGPSVFKVRIMDDAAYAHTMHSTVNIATATQVGNITHTLAAAAVTPTASTVNLNSASLMAPDDLIVSNPMQGVLCGGLDRIPGFSVRRLDGGN